MGLLGCAIQVPDGRFACDPQNGCPSGYSCIAGRCRSGEPSDGSVDVGSDARSVDAGLDAREPDAYAVDANSLDARSLDASVVDAGSDAGSDAFTTDVGTDAGTCNPASCPWGCAGASCDRPLQVSTTDIHTCMVTTGHRLWCWGANENWELGTTVASPVVRPIRISSITDAVEVRTGSSGTCVRLLSGAVRCTGNDDAGQIGNGLPLSPVSRFTDTTPVLSTTALGSGYLTYCAVDVDSSVWCWGSDFYTDQVPVPTHVMREPASDGVLLTGAVEVACEVVACCARLDAAHGGAVACWGNNDGHGLGDGTTIRRTGAVLALGVTNATALFSGDYQHFAIAGDAVYEWGAHRPPPSDVGAPVGTIALANGDSHTCFLLATRRVVCLGNDNTHGQVGVGSTSVVTTPTDVGLADVVSMTSAWYHSCAITGAGLLYCWGANNQGQIGNGDALLADVHAPVLITP